jgi:AcrR family transcriptional regulator
VAVGDFLRYGFSAGSASAPADHSSETMTDFSETQSESRRSIGAARNPESHAAILEAAGAILTEQGYAGFSIEAVARRAKAGKPTIYRWWPSKAHLLLDVYTRLKDHLLEPDTGTLEGDLRQFLTNLIRFWAGAPGDVFRSLIAEAQTDAKAGEALREYCVDRIAHTAGMIDRAKARGEVPEDVDSLAGSDLLSAFAWKLLLTGRLEGVEAEVAAVARIMAHGMVPGR